METPNCRSKRTALHRIARDVREYCAQQLAPGARRRPSAQHGQVGPSGHPANERYRPRRRFRAHSFPDTHRPLCRDLLSSLSARLSLELTALPLRGPQNLHRPSCHLPGSPCAPQCEPQSLPSGRPRRSLREDSVQIDQLPAPSQLERLSSTRNNMDGYAP